MKPKKKPWKNLKSRDLGVSVSSTVKTNQGRSPARSGQRGHQGQRGVDELWSNKLKNEAQGDSDND